MQKYTTDTLLVGIDFSHGVDTGVLIIGRKNPKYGTVDIINAFQGQEAEELYKKLVEKKV